MAQTRLIRHMALAAVLIVLGRRANYMLSSIGLALPVRMRRLRGAVGPDARLTASGHAR
jgi:hypothetical protein